MLHVGTICAVFRCHVGRCCFFALVGAFLSVSVVFFGLVGAFLSPLVLHCFRFSESIGFGLFLDWLAEKELSISRRHKFRGLGVLGFRGFGVLGLRVAKP